MQIPKIPTNEAERLQVLRELLILDTPREERFDIITQFAASRFGVSIALVSLVDEHRQWFKSACGLSVNETSRDVSFCGHAIHSNEVMIVPNALSDPRFVDNPLVTGPPNIRFYMGAPLKINGQNIGTLCLIDTVPHQVDKHEVDSLNDLAALTVEVLLNETLDVAGVKRQLE